MEINIAKCRVPPWCL